MTNVEYVYFILCKSTSPLKKTKNQSKLICSLDTCLLEAPNASHWPECHVYSILLSLPYCQEMYTLASIHVKAYFPCSCHLPFLFQRQYQKGKEKPLSIKSWKSRWTVKVTGRYFLGQDIHPGTECGRVWARRPGPGAADASGKSIQGRSLAAESHRHYSAKVWEEFR